MSEENKPTETSLPKFDLPKSAAPTIKIPVANVPPAGVAPVFAKRPADFGNSGVEEKKESPAMTALDAVCAVVAVAFAVIMFLELK